MAPGPLTVDEILSFKANGYVIVRGFFPTDTVDRWRRQVWAATTVNADDWPDGDFAGTYTGTVRSSGQRNTALFTPEARKRLVYPFPGEDTVADPFPIEPAIIDEPNARAALNQLVGEGTYGSGIGAPGDAGAGFENDVVVINWPGTADARSTVPYHKPHVEGMRPDRKGGCVCRWFVGMTTYLDDVSPGGGATYVWPKSHLAVHRYFQDWPRALPSGGAINDKLDVASVHGVPACGPRGGMTADYMNSALPGSYDSAPHEAVMQKGDVLIWHHWCVHASSTNYSDRVRQAIITRFHTTRWGHEQMTDAGGVATNKDMWKYWADDVRNAQPSRLPGRPPKL